ncbi:MAG: sigma 54-interacting transcriptional regulator [Pirellulaceae bacterium]
MSDQLESGVSRQQSPSDSTMLAYLVIREGSKWSDVFRLVPGRTVTVGRAPTNQIVVKDEQCSRHHAEIFVTQGRWTLRDLDSRNGTAVGAQRVRGDYALSPGDVIRIAHAQLAFVYDISDAFGENGGATRRDWGDELADETVSTRRDALEPYDSDVLEPHETTTITDRRGQTRYLEPAENYDDVTIPKVGRAATTLCRLAFELANQKDITSAANLALNGLFEGTNVDAGGVLLVPRDTGEAKSVHDLQVVASRTDNRPSYHRVTNFLAMTVLREGEAVLARNIEGDSALGTRDSKGEILATSVICAPIRRDAKVIGLVHLYSTSSSRLLDSDDLEFALAVADNVALAMTNLEQRQELADKVLLSKSEIDQLRRRLGAESQIVGSSEQMGRVHQDIARAASARTTVLIRGESGVGKELVARAVHFSSPRKQGPFVCLNCAALTETLLESELFGHERGAFTGATDRKIGKFEAADQGTLMLDEIGEMSPAIQAKFLRVLEGHPFERVGGNKAIKVDVRVIAATNRDLEKAVSEGEFRRDLYFRLNVFEIKVPSLRKRPDDVIELATFFLKRFSAETGRRLRGFTPEAVRQLKEYRWPGNVRELKNVIERAVLLARDELIDVGDVTLSNLSTASESGLVAQPRNVYEPATLADIERGHILATLNATGWNKSRTAAILGIERSTLDRKIRRYELSRRSAKP